MLKEKILIADDSEMNRSILADMLGEDYDMLEAENGVEAVSVLSKQADSLSLVLLDIVMPQMDGFGVLDAMNQNGWIENLPVIIISAENNAAQVERAYEKGAADFIARPFDWYIVQRRVINTLLLYAKQKKLIGMVEEQVREKERHSDLMTDILGHIVEFRNGESGPHILHVRILTRWLLRLLTEATDKYRLTDEEIAIINTASALHDIGKIAIDENILNKPGKLTPEEFEIMKTHSAVGAEMLGKLPMYRDEPLVRTAYEICRWHHERYDGNGYPDGLKGDEIPISAQVVALADVYDALTSERIYKPSFSHEQAVKMIVNGECGSFNPILIECLEKNAPSLKIALERGFDEARNGDKRSGFVDGALKTESGASKRTLQLLDRERVRNNFFASMSEAIQFEYTVSPPMISLSAWGAKKLGLDEIIMEPLKDEKLFDVLEKRFWDELSERLRNSTPENPEVRLECPLHYEGSTRWHKVVMRAIWSDDAIPRFDGALGTVIDIHASRLEMEQLARKATRDPLTGLLNKNSAKEQIELRLSEISSVKYALVIFDLDHFKSANDTYGHLFGDNVLKHVAECLNGSARGTDISCRAGGDEFMLFLEYKTDIEKTIDRIYHSICGRYEQFDVVVSMGVALGEDIGRSYEALFKAADAALYAAKRGGRGSYRFYDKSLENILNDDHETFTVIYKEDQTR